jgi:hypothetical protein
MRRFALAMLVAIASIGLGCKPQIGDSCKLSTDCSVTGDRLCDTSMPDGYCTIFSCEPNSCPDNAVCVQFHPSSPRLSRTFCVAGCDKGSDCRTGYQCIAPASRDSVIIDQDPTHSNLCLP